MGAPDNTRAIPSVSSLDTVVLPMQGQDKVVAMTGQGVTTGLVGSRGYGIIISCPLITTVEITYRTGGVMTVYVQPGTRRVIPARDFVRVVCTAASGNISLWLEDVRTLGLCPP